MQPDSTRRHAALTYLSRGWAVIPVPSRSKNPGRPGWQHERWRVEDAPARFGGPGNISLLAGEPSNGVADVDCDCPEALVLADHFLPPTGSAFGRVSTPGSHRLYQVTGELSTRKYTDPVAAGEHRGSLVELRWTGTSTLLPPSIYPEGEACAWQQDGDPGAVTASELTTAVARLAAASLLVRYWPASGSRHDAALALAGGLARGGWTADEVGSFIGLVAWAAGDDEPNDRILAASSTATNRAAGQPTTGWPSLAQLLPSAIVDRVRSWLVGDTPRSASVASPEGADESASPDQEAGSGGTQSGRGPSQSTILVDLAHDANIELFHDAQGDPFATIPMAKHWETWPLRSKGFRQYLARAYFLAHGRTPGSQALKDAIEVLAGEAQFAGPERDVAVRLAAVDGSIYLDLGDADWQIIRITASAWGVITHEAAPVRFRRPRGLLALPMPVRGGSILQLRRFVNCADESDWLLVVGWLLGCFYPHGPRAILQLLGEQGSAKSTLARLLRSLVDPNQVPLRTQPRDEGDLLIAATNGALVAIDNLSEIPRWLSDAFCRMATGGGLSKRELYTDTDEILLDARRPVLLTAIAEIATASDLLDRCLTVMLTAISADQRQTEASIGQAFTAAQPGILGALLDAVSLGLARMPSIRLEHAPRLADFATWVEAAAPAFGWEAGAFLDAMEQNRRTADAIAIEALPIGSAVLAFMTDRDEWQGSPSELLALLTEQVSDEVRRDKEWPKRANRFSGQLRRLAPNLRQVGLWVGSDRRPGSGQRLIMLTKNHRLWDRHQRHDRHNVPQERNEHHRLSSSQGPSPHRHASDMDRHRGPETTPETPAVTSGRDGRDDGDDVQARLPDEQVNGTATPDADEIEVLTL